MFCGNCGKQIMDGLAFCPSCGSKIAEADMAAQPVQQTQPVQQAPVQLQAAQPVQSSEGMAQGITQGQFNQYNQQVQYNQQYAQMQMAANQVLAKKSKKPLIITLAILLAAVITFLIIAFATGLFGKAVYGTWYREEDPSEYMIIKSNAIEIYEDGEMFYKYDIKVSGDSITVKNPYGGQPQIMTYKLSGDYMYITNGKGSEETFTRKKPAGNYHIDF